MPKATSFLCLLVGSLSLLACGAASDTAGDQSYAASVQPGTRGSKDKLEFQILKQLSSFVTGKAQPLYAHTVTVGPPYDAASGRTCRHVRIAGDRPRSLLVCLMPTGWKFVPEVFSRGPT